jgi:DNA-binding NtrC family response regulator
MSPVAMRILVVGKPCGSTAATLSRLALDGWVADTAETVAKAKSVLKMFRLDAVLSEENLPDGRGYDLADAVAQQSSTLLVSVALSESCLWLPVIERGDRSLGQRAVTPDMLGFELETILSSAHRAANRGALAGAHSDSHRDSHAHPKRELPPRRKSAPAASPNHAHAPSLVAAAATATAKS